MTTVVAFEVGADEEQLVAVVERIREHDGTLDGASFGTIVRGHPKRDGVFSKSDLIRGFRRLKHRYGWDDEETFVRRLRMKPIRTLSGVAPVTILTKPFPCPGRCIFCPSDVRMPKSYLAREPGAQRAAQHAFDPYAQTLGRLLALHHTGHAVDKVELIILGGTWSFYPPAYQRWFVLRAFEAMNDFAAARRRSDRGGDVALGHGPIDFEALDDAVDGRDATGVEYNRTIRGFLRGQLAADGRDEHADSDLLGAEESATWAELEAAQRINETAMARCVGLVVETRPDRLDLDEVIRIRRLGATKVQIGFQSLDDAVLAANHRGHDVAATRRAVALLRQAGFKLHAHWMPNLYGSDPARDRQDFARLWDDPAFRPDELKIYPCSLIESAELMRYHDDGRWQPYSTAILTDLLADCLAAVPPYCRVTCMIRDIPGDDIVTGNLTTNLRQVVEKKLARDGRKSRDIRAREIRGADIDPSTVRLETVIYDTAVGEERFLQAVTKDDRLCGFLRLSLPRRSAAAGGDELDGGDGIEEIGASAMIREVHVYGRLARIDGEQAGGRRGCRKAQHQGLGSTLIEAAAAMAAEAGFGDLAVISSVGTRDYYRRRGFADGTLYQHRSLEKRPAVRQVAHTMA